MAAPNQAGLEAVEKLKKLREDLDAGSIQVNEFVKQGKELADFIFNEQLRLGAGGRSSAQFGDQLRQTFQAANTGWKQQHIGADDDGAKVDLGAEYQQRLREELLPGNLPEEERRRLIEDLPADIGFDTDRFNIEREGIRQRVQAEAEAAKAKEQRQTRLGELATLLATQADQAYDENSPKLLEDLNARGLFHSSATGKALAGEKTRQQQITQNLLAAQGLSDRDADIGSMEAIGKASRAFQTSGLSRDMSNDDRARAFTEALTLANMSQPQNSGGGKGGSIVQGAAAGAAAGTGAGGPGWGTVIGAVLGGGAGAIR
jgi:hypothetical protein